MALLSAMRCPTHAYRSSRYAERALKAVTDPLCIGSEAKKQVIIAMLTDYLGAKVLPLKYISEPREEFLTENIGLLAQTNSLHIL